MSVLVIILAILVTGFLIAAGKEKNHSIIVRFSFDEKVNE
jgi:hypothetical protein